MTALVWLIPISIVFGLIGLAAFFWSLRTHQYEDLDGARHRILREDDDRPL